ncbi:1-acyl-sn-glycerol-3-phosphate acyltransferase [Desulfovibrio sp. OttesenSCG-928-M14]|nr:1-acyl-sn-glycerol-3-phosphate acyltransferase [Desulfovibrio sp. OttesenSCG-928-M14]
MPPFKFKSIAINEIPFPGDSYESPPGMGGALATRFPSFFYTWYVVDIIRHEGNLASAGLYDGKAWCEGSLRTMRLLEHCGVRFSISGMDNIDKVEGPCVFVGNHMSTLETFVLPVLIQPRKAVTYVVKKSLLGYPWFGQVLKSREPVVVERQNARQDFSTVMTEGCERLGRGLSVIVFPQSTRSETFDPEHFNSMGIKLAKKAGLPVIPFALRTNAWKNGSFVKDYGGLDPSRRVFFSFGEPLTIQGNGKAEHNAICDFVQTHLKKWEGQDPV